MLISQEKQLVQTNLVTWLEDQVGNETPDLELEEQLRGLTQALQAGALDSITSCMVS